MQARTGSIGKTYADKKNLGFEGKQSGGFNAEFLKGGPDKGGFGGGFDKNLGFDREYPSTAGWYKTAVSIASYCCTNNTATSIARGADYPRGSGFGGGFNQGWYTRLLPYHPIVTSTILLLLLLGVLITQEDLSTQDQMSVVG